MTRRPFITTVGLAFVCCFGLGCNDAPGHPRESSIPINPANVSDFATLFASNCSGCHGDQGKGGPATPITDPVYVAIADDTIIRKAVTKGIAGTSMPAFATSAGGMLTDKQIDIIVAGIREHYAKPGVLAGSSAPPYATAIPGDATRGAAAYTVFCSSCHGDAGRGGSKASPIVDGSFLALLTDQTLRTLVIVGRPDFGAPDWRNNVAGKPMSSQEISDVVAWLSAQRPQLPGSPYPTATKSAGDAR
jgi:mono/diheme cytochrome c family protein